LSATSPTKMNGVKHAFNFILFNCKVITMMINQTIGEKEMEK